MAHPDTPLNSIKGLGKVYATQTMCICEGGTVASMCKHVAPLFRLVDADAEQAIIKWACECARNPRAGQQADNGYVVPQYNTRVARTLVELLVECTANRHMFSKERHRVVPSSAWLMTLNGVLKNLPARQTPTDEKEATSEVAPKRRKVAK